MPWIPQGDANLAYWCALLHDTPIVAIGGMDAARTRDAKRAGAWAVAVVGGITRRADPRAAIRALQEAAVAVPRAAPADLPAFARTTLSVGASAMQDRVRPPASHAGC